jgi:hypothetical protein
VTGVRAGVAWVRWNSSSKSENWHVGNVQPCRISKCVIHDATLDADRRVHGRTANRIGDTAGLRFGPIQSPAGRRWLTETKEIRQTVIEGADHRFMLETRIAHATDGGRRIGAFTGVLVEPAHVACCLSLVSCYFLTSLLEQELSFISRTAQAIVCPRNSQFATRTRNGQ